MGIKFQEMFRRYVFKVVVITKKKMFGGILKIAYGLKEKGILGIIISGVEVGMFVFKKQKNTVATAGVSYN